MDKEKKGTEVTPPVIPTEGKEIAPSEDAEAKVAALEAEKATILEREANYKAAYLKEKAKNREPDLDETDEEKFRRIAREEMAEANISKIDTEKEVLLKKLAKENKELKLAQLNRTDIPASTTTHTEGQGVKDTIISPEQMASFKAMGKDDKWIANYKKNLLKNR